MKALLTNMFWFREEDLELKKVRKQYERRMFDEKACSRCEYKEERFLPEVCGVCDGHLGRHVTWSSKTSKNGTELIGLPRGDVENFHRVGIDVSDLYIIDKRTGKRMVSPKYGLEWTRPLWPEQQRLVKRWLSGAYLENLGMEAEPFGLIQAPPRTGKTTMVLYCAFKLKEKILVIANQDDLLLQFIQDLRDCTNIEEVEAAEGRRFHGLVKNTRDLARLDFGFCTWQSFRDGSTKLSMEEVSKNYSILALDEAHRGAAAKFSKVLNRSTSKYRLPVSATPSRKDGLHFRLHQIMGPVVAKGRVEALEPEWSLNMTNCKPDKPIGLWARILNWLANCEPREDYIISCIIQDVKDGHNVVVPVDRVAQCESMAAKLNKRGIKAMAFHGKSKREDVLQAARSGAIRVVIGMRSILSTGVNVPRWSCYYGISPISNDPNFYQEYKRVCTKFEGKKQPILRMFVDDIGVSYGCFKTCWKQLKHLKPLDEESLEKAKEIVSGKRKGAKNGASLKELWGPKKLPSSKVVSKPTKGASGNRVLANRPPDDLARTKPYTGQKAKAKKSGVALYGAKSAW